MHSNLCLAGSTNLILNRDSSNTLCRSRLADVRLTRASKKTELVRKDDDAIQGVRSAKGTPFKEPGVVNILSICFRLCGHKLRKNDKEEVIDQRKNLGC